MSQLTGRHLLVASLLIIAVFGLAFQFQASGTSETQTPEPPILEVNVAPLTMQTEFTRFRYFTGAVEAAQSSELSFKRGGRVDELLVDDGATVEAGQVLARLDARDVTARRNQLSADVRQAEARLAELRAGPRKEAIAVARAEVAQLAAEVKLAVARHDRTESLVAKRTLTKDDFEASQTNLDSIRAQHDAALARLDELETGTRQEQLDAQSALVESMRAALAQVDVEISDSELVAPYAGKISLRRIDPGSIVAAGQPIFRIEENSRLEFRVGVTDAAASQILRDGESVSRVSVAGYEFPTVLDRALPILNSTTRTRTLIYRLPESAEHSPLPGQIGELGVALSVREQGAWVPNAALVGGIQGLWSCYVLADTNDESVGTIRRCDVEILHVESDRSFVRGTLADGDLVVVAGPHRVAQGQRVRGLPLQEVAP